MYICCLSYTLYIMYKSMFHFFRFRVLFKRKDLLWSSGEELQRAICLASEQHVFVGLTPGHIVDGLVRHPFVNLPAESMSPLPFKIISCIYLVFHICHILCVTSYTYKIYVGDSESLGHPTGAPPGVATSSTCSLPLPTIPKYLRLYLEYQ